MIVTCLQSLRISIWILRTLMHLYAETRPGPSQATKIKLFAGIVEVFKLMLLTIFANTIMDIGRALITPLICSNVCS